jgi:3-methyladenine DNA glycosylase AlkD
MPARPTKKAVAKKTAATKATPKKTAPALRSSAPRNTAPAPRDVDTVLRQLQQGATEQFRADMSDRYGIVTRDKTLGTPMAKIKAIAKTLGKDHAFAERLWRTGVYEARMLASMVAAAESVTVAQMDLWAKDFDNWATVDTLCFNLFDRTPHVFGQVAKWAKSKDEFVKRAAFALLACAALHKRGEDADFLAALPLVERAASDERNFVKKGVSWALRAIGGKKSPKLRAAARELAQKLAASEDASARWVGKDALRAFAKAKT